METKRVEKILKKRNKEKEIKLAEKLDNIRV